MNLEDIKKLADMARIEMTEDEMQEVTKSFGSILEYVGQVQEVNKMSGIGDKSKEDYFLHNVMRDDVVTNESGVYRDKIINEIPETENGYLKVKQIL
jgi:aspartyl-tRNA(Asn)/glutamyl-tRNA(Gln) amidotransferase subunit C